MKRNRKEFVCYPPNYQPGDGYEVVKSKRQMWKVLYKFGAGAQGHVVINVRCRDGSITSTYSSKIYQIYLED